MPGVFIGILLAVLAIPQVSALQDQGTSLPNGVGDIYQVITPLLVLLIAGVLLGGSVVAFLLIMLRD